MPGIKASTFCRVEGELWVKDKNNSIIFFMSDQALAVVNRLPLVPTQRMGTSKKMEIPMLWTYCPTGGILVPKLELGNKRKRVKKWKFLCY